MATQRLYSEDDINVTRYMLVEQANTLTEMIRKLVYGEDRQLPPPSKWRNDTSLRPNSLRCVTLPQPLEGSGVYCTLLIEPSETLMRMRYLAQGMEHVEFTQPVEYEDLTLQTLAEVIQCLYFDLRKLEAATRTSS